MTMAEKCARNLPVSIHSKIPAVRIHNRTRYVGFEYSKIARSFVQPTADNHAKFCRCLDIETGSMKEAKQLLMSD